jgi:hypothetical protein
MRLFSALLAVAAFVLPLRADEVEPLIFNQGYKPGHTYHQTMDMSQRMELDTGDAKVLREMTTKMGMQAIVTPLEDGHRKRVAVKYDAVRATLIDERGQKFSFDSKNPTASNAGDLAGYGRVVGQEFKVIFDEQENVTDVENLEATIQNLSGNQPNGAQIYQQVFSPSSVKSMMQQAILRSPTGKPVKVGGSWAFSQELVLPNIGKLVIRGFYTFKGMTKRNGVDCAEVTAAAEIKLDVGNVDAAGDEAAQKVQQMKLKMEVGAMEGTLYYDPAIAFTREVVINHDIVLTGRIPDGSGKTLRLPMKQQIGMTLDSYETSGK